MNINLANLNKISFKIQDSEELQHGMKNLSLNQTQNQMFRQLINNQQSRSSKLFTPVKKESLNECAVESGNESPQFNKHPQRTLSVKIYSKEDHIDDVSLFFYLIDF